MCAFQWVIGVGGVIESHRRPFFRHVAGFTGLAEVPFMIIVFEMARDAGHIEFVGERVLAVAVAALRECMTAGQRKAGVASVVELGVRPARG